MGLRGKKALVLASSQGLGKAVAKQLAAEGADVMLASRNEDQLKDVQQELLALGGGGRVEYCVTDVTRKQDIDALMRGLVRRQNRHFGQQFGRAALRHLRVVDG